MQVAIIDYNAGNVRSVLYAMERLGAEAVLTDDHELIRKAERVIFPGVGEANTTMRYLRERGLDELIPSLTQPVLGICLGMQLMCSRSEENQTDCLGIIPQQVRRFKALAGEKVPHMGWNRILQVKNGLLGPGQEGQYVYFVHSYYVEEGPFSTALCEHILPFSAALQKDNFFATQFHPEKSGPVGEAILRNFLKTGEL